MHRRSRPGQLTCSATFDLDAKRARLRELDAEINDPSLWDDPRNAASLTQEASRLREEIAAVGDIEKRTADAVDLGEMVEAEPDEAVTAEVTAELNSLEKELDRRELELLYSDPYSDNPAILGIHAGAGGTNSQDWAEMLMRMYLHWAEQKKYTVEFIDKSPGDEAGIKSATLRIVGPRAFGLLKSERGVHRLVRISPFELGGAPAHLVRARRGHAGDRGRHRHRHRPQGRPRGRLPKQRRRWPARQQDVIGDPPDPHPHRRGGHVPERAIPAPEP